MIRRALGLVLGVSLLSGCPPRDVCLDTPFCEENRATNCEPLCQVGPCSNSPSIQPCGAEASCQIVPGDQNSPRFFRSRALCVLNEADNCDPAPAPSCDDNRIVTGCSAYRRQIRISCTQAGLFFESAPCCSGPSTPADAGTDGGVDGGSDAGTTDGGIADAGGSDSGL